MKPFYNVLDPAEICPSRLDAGDQEASVRASGHNYLPIGDEVAARQELAWGRSVDGDGDHRRAIRIAWGVAETGGGDFSRGARSDGNPLVNTVSWEEGNCELHLLLSLVLDHRHSPPRINHPRQLAIELDFVSLYQTGVQWSSKFLGSNLTVPAGMPWWRGWQ